MIKESTSRVGGGTMPEVELPTYTAVLKHKQLSSSYVANALRNRYSPAIVVRIQNDEIYVDLRTMTDEEVQFLIGALVSIK
jgi:L-seryl-tRNA(Ser) seleniumtransferase